MTVEIFTPSRTHDLGNADAVGVEGIKGSRTLLPHHVDCTLALATGLMMIRTKDNNERYVGVDGGTLVKVGQQVSVSTPRVAMEEELGMMRESLDAEQRRREEHSREARQALARLEIELARSLFEAEAGG